MMMKFVFLIFVSLAVASRFGKRSTHTMVAQERQIMKAAQRVEFSRTPHAELMAAAEMIDEDKLSEIPKKTLAMAAIDARRILSNRIK